MEIRQMSEQIKTPTDDSTFVWIDRGNTAEAAGCNLRVLLGPLGQEAYRAALAAIWAAGAGSIGEREHPDEHRLAREVYRALLNGKPGDQLLDLITDEILEVVDECSSSRTAMNVVVAALEIDGMDDEEEDPRNWLTAAVREAVADALGCDLDVTDDMYDFGIEADVKEHEGLTDRKLADELRWRERALEAAGGRGIDLANEISSLRVAQAVRKARKGS
jgi:hypothetical protein